MIAGTYVDSPGISQLALDDAIEAYTLPQGVLSQLMREMAAGRPGLVTRTGLHTFVDPCRGGGRQSARATDDLVELVTLAGEEWLFFPRLAVDVAFLRGTTADEDGNVSMEQEAVYGEMLAMAQATRVVRVARATTTAMRVSTRGARKSSMLASRTPCASRRKQTAPDNTSKSWRAWR